MMRTPYEKLKGIAYPLWALCLVLLVALLIPGIGTKAGGAVRWLRLGPFSFQPAELAKLSVIILLAYSLAKKDYDRIKLFSIGVLPNLLLVLPVCALVIVQPDFGTSMMIGAVLFVMLFAGGVRKVYLGMLGGAGAAAAAALIAAKGYRVERLFSYLNPWEDATGAGFQIVQSFLAFGSGSLTGTGLGRGTQKLFYLPEPHTDFILAVVGEELGFLGVLAVIALFGAVLYCGIAVALHAHDLFGTYLAFGITVMLGMQAALNMGVVLGLLPTKGMPLPFLSYGGSSLLLSLAGIGMLLSIAERCNFATRT
jgi:cell division protein FtsW